MGYRDDTSDAWDDDSSDDDEYDIDDIPTVPCPYCGCEILEDAERCPECENYISKEYPIKPRISSITVGKVAFFLIVIWLIWWLAHG